MAINYNKDNQVNKSDIFKTRRNLNRNMKNVTKSDRLMEGIGTWASYYRLFPHIFVREYLQINLKCFQQILIYFMMHFNYFLYLASRGQGKTWLTAIFCVTRSILFPETKIILASGQKSQAIEIIEKIMDLKGNSPNLAREIEDIKTSATDARCVFRNGSWIRVVASNQGARSKRANLIVVDEFRMVDKNIVDSVLRKFMTAPRQPKYLSKPEYKHLKERNKEIYLSSCWYKYHWSWDKVNTYKKAILEGKSYFACGLPYQLSIHEGLLDENQVLDEMSEDDFDETSWLMEMQCMFFGESDKAYFKFDDLEINRKITKAIYPKNTYKTLKDNKFKYENKVDGEIRFISCDISSVAGKQNDASAYTIFRLIPKYNKDGKFNRFDRQICFMETMVGGHSTVQALRIRELFEEFDCDYIVIDAQNFGLAIYDQMCMDLFDREKGIEYPAISCMNNDEMASRCIVPDAPKLVFAVKASSSLNSEMAISLKNNLKNGRYKFLISELECREYLLSLKGYEELTVEQQAKLKQPYLQTTYMINEFVNLSNEGKDGIVKLKEPSSGRKDRFTSILYGDHFAKYLENLYKQLDETEYEEFDSIVLW